MLQIYFALFRLKKGKIENEILNLHKIILSGIDDTNAGFYRDCMVRISGSRTILPNPVKIPNLMNDF